ncbi:MAG TPA: protease inhibitor I9 family protein [Longimicrobium sp.]|nr:protease inhibitor I9 family protein [Longimicrobium sp.]
MRITAPAALLLALAACSGSITGGAPELDRGIAAQCVRPAPLHGTPDPRTAGSYIVVFHDGTPSAAVTARLAGKYGFEPKHVYEHALRGFAATLSDDVVAGIRCEPEVRFVEHDAVVTIGG